MTDETDILSLAAIHALSRDALIGAGASKDVAEIMAQSVAEAEADGIRSIGLAYLPVYLRQLRIGKVRGDAVARFREGGPGVLLGDAGQGFAHAAFVAGETRFYEMARAQGIAGCSLRRSYASGVIGWFSERMARAGLVGLTVTNASPTMAPAGGARPIFGTNPIALGVPRGDLPPLVIDVSPAATTRLAIKEAAAAGAPIPPGWGRDAGGDPCTDPQSVLAGGTVAPIGAHKGAALAMLVEILAAGLSGARWSFEASDLGDDLGGPPEIGQLFLALAPERFAGSGFVERIGRLAQAVEEQPGARLPGDRRRAHRAAAADDGIAVPRALLAEIRQASPN